MTFTLVFYPNKDKRFPTTWTCKIYCCYLPWIQLPSSSYFLQQTFFKKEVKEKKRQTKHIAIVFYIKHDLVHLI